MGVDLVDLHTNHGHPINSDGGAERPDPGSALDFHSQRGHPINLGADRGVVPTNQNSRLTLLLQPRSVRGDREGRTGSFWVFMMGVQL